MRRTEKLNISIRPGVKEAAFLLFKGNSISRSFEAIIFDRLKTTIKGLEKEVKELSAVDTASLPGERVGALIHTEKNIAEIKLRELLQVEKTAFPDGLIER